MQIAIWTTCYQTSRTSNQTSLSPSAGAIVLYMLDPILAAFQFQHWSSSSRTGTPTFPNQHHAKMGHPVLELDDPVPELALM
jgi:hypothetical protein